MLRSASPLSPPTWPWSSLVAMSEVVAFARLERRGGVASRKGKKYGTKVARKTGAPLPFMSLSASAAAPSSKEVRGSAPRRAAPRPRRRKTTEPPDAAPPRLRPAGGGRAAGRLQTPPRPHVRRR